MTSRVFPGSPTNVNTTNLAAPTGVTPMPMQGQFLTAGASGSITPQFLAQIRTLYPWFTEELVNIYIDSWSEYQNADVALQEVRQSAEYDVIFGGNYDPQTGSVRMTENDYFAAKANFDASLISIGLNPDFFQDDWITALEGEVSPAEMSQRLDAAYTRIIDSAPAIRDYYATNFGIELTDSAIVASVLKPSLGDQILNRQITMAEIGGEAALRGFNVTKAFAQELFQAGLGRTQAQQFFGEATGTLPVLSVLARRHADPNDEFNLEDFTVASLYDDPVQRQRMRRLVAQERTLFSGQAGGPVRSTAAGQQFGLEPV